MEGIVTTEVTILMMNGREYVFRFTGSTTEAENYVSKEIEMRGCYSTHYKGAQVAIYLNGIESITYKTV